MLYRMAIFRVEIRYFSFLQSFQTYLDSFVKMWSNVNYVRVKTNRHRIAILQSTLTSYKAGNYMLLGGLWSLIALPAKHPNEDCVDS